MRMLGAARSGAAVVIPPDLDRRLRRGRGAEISIWADASNPTVAAAVTLAGQGLGQTLSARVQPFLTGDASAALRAPPRRSRALRAGVRRGPPRADSHRRRPLLQSRAAHRRVHRARAGRRHPDDDDDADDGAGHRARARARHVRVPDRHAGAAHRGHGRQDPPLHRRRARAGALILGLGALLFDVPIQGSLLDLGVGALAFIAAMLTMGLLVSSLAKTQFQSVQMSFFFFLPSMLLSGFMFPFEAMPVPAQWIGTLPAAHPLPAHRARHSAEGRAVGELAGRSGGHRRASPRWP